MIQGNFTWIFQKGNKSLFSAFFRVHLRETDVWGFRGFPPFVFVVVFFGQVSKAFSRGRRGNRERIKKMFGLVKQKRRKRKVLCVSLNPSQLPLFSFSESGEGEKCFTFPFFRMEIGPPIHISAAAEKGKIGNGGKTNMFCPPCTPSFFPVSSSRQWKFPNLAKLTPLRNPPPLEKEKRRKLFSFLFLRLGDLWCRRPRKEKNQLFFFRRPENHL